jgi:hypothetical protein
MLKKVVRSQLSHKNGDLPARPSASFSAGVMTILPYKSPSQRLTYNAWGMIYRILAPDLIT